MENKVRKVRKEIYEDLKDSLLNGYYTLKSNNDKRFLPTILDGEFNINEMWSLLFYSDDIETMQKRGTRVENTPTIHIRLFEYGLNDNRINTLLKRVGKEFKKRFCVS